MSGLTEPADANVDRVIRMSKREFNGLRKNGYAIIHTQDGEFVKVEVRE